MPVVVQKYGGTSVADPKRISSVADRVEQTRSAGNDVVIVVSAMGTTTDQLLGLAAEITTSPPPRELDMLLTAGERITMALLAMALDKRNIPAVSYTGSQAGILTDSSHGEARITRITGERVKESLAEGKVVIVAGFQGVDPDRKEVTTLGRGGSDTTAVALAVTLGAEVCEIFTDVEGVYTADPRMVPDASKIASISFDDMLAMAGSGAGVLARHSVELAAANGIPIHVRSAFNFESGTEVEGTGHSETVVGMAVSTIGDQGRISIVGGDADQVTDSARAILSQNEVSLAAIGGDDGVVTVEIAADLVENALSLLHHALLKPSREDI